MRPLMYVLAVAALLAPLALADGPNFTNDIVISNGTPDLVFEDTTPTETNWEICVDGGCPSGGVDEAFNLGWWNDFGLATPLVIERGTEDFLIYVDRMQMIGIGTSVPGADLEIEGAAPNIILDDRTTGAGKTSWSLSTYTGAIQGDDNQLIVRYDVRAPLVLEIDESGKATFENDVQLNSSREAKTAIEEVDRSEVLSRLGQLPISYWSYKTQGPDVRHLGPMAEDFHAAFGLGDTDSAISLVDVAGVALAAVQELSQQVGRLKAEIRELRSEPGRAE